MNVADRTVQLLLLAAGETLPVYGADGQAGAETRAALSRFEAKHAPPKPAAPAIIRPTTTPGRLYDADISHLATVRVGRMKSRPKAMLWHHTAGHLGPEGTVRVLNQRSLSVQYVMSRDARMYQTNPELFTCWHAGNVDKAPWKGKGLSNGNMLGCEVDAKLPEDVTDAQVARAVAFAIDLEKQFPGILHLGHGETSLRKMPAEGLRIAQTIRGPDFKIKPELLAR